jgi:Cu2+-exporting ATPase
MSQAIAPLSARDATLDVACSHCNLPVPRALVVSDADEQFCCDGCRTVFQVIHGAGLERYYLDKLELGVEGRPAVTSDKTYRELDDPAFLAAYAKPAGPGLLEVELYLENLHCPACVWLVEKLSKLTPAVVSSTVDLGRSTVRVRWAPEDGPLSEIATALASLGYPPHPRQSADTAELRRVEDRALLARMAVAGAVFGNVMLLALALYSGAFQGMDAEYQSFFRWASLVVVTPSVLFSASVFFRGAWGALKVRTPHMDLPVSIGILAGYISGAVNVIRGAGDIYFDSVAAVVFLLLVGRWLQRRQQHAAKSAAELLYSFAPSSARLVEGDSTRDVPIESVAQGAVLEVRAGESFPADGVVIDGASAVDASLLTGEPRPQEVAVGSPVHAGTVNVAARLLVRAEVTGQATRVGRLLAAVDDASARRAPIALAADRMAGRFVLTVLGLSAATALLWWHVSPHAALDHAISLLIVTCPCALGLATPLAVSAAIGKAAKNGILIKGGDSLERLARASLVVFDKTGTLTEGRLELTEWRGDPELRPLVAAAEAQSAHPIARAFQRALADEVALEVSEHRQTPGGGIEARIEDHAVVVGSPRFVAGHAEVEPEWRELAESAAARGETAVLVAVDGHVRGAACFADPVREDARQSLDRLRELGHPIAILSGDQAAVVERVATRLGVPETHVTGGAMPEQKLEIIEQRVSEGPVVMVGDGVNDAAALARADVGIAVHGGAEASLAAADVFTTRHGVGPIVELFEGARRTLRVIRLNMALSVFYNLICVTLAMTGLIAPWIAAILMPLSSLTVVTLSYRAHTFARSP